MLTVLGFVAHFAFLWTAAFVLNKTVPRLANMACRFALLFVLCVPLNFIINWFNVRLLGYHKMGWTGASVIALVLATFGTFYYSPRPRNSDTR